MKYNYIRFFSIGLLAALCCFLYMPTNAQTTVTVDGIGDFHLHPTQYGDFIGLGDTITGDFAIVLDESGTALGSACDPLDDTKYVDKIVILGYGFSEADSCGSEAKVLNLQEAGAKAAIIIYDGTFPPNFSDVNDIGTIPVFVITAENVGELISNLGAIESGKIFYKYDNSVTPSWSEDFSSGFNSPNGQWTTENILGNDTMVWQYDTTATSNGYFRTFIIDSPTKGNGVAIMDNGAYLSANGAYEPPFNSSTGYGEVKAELISPVIDLSTSGPITVRWWQYAAGLNFDVEGSYVTFSYSTDGGETWSTEQQVVSASVVNSGIVYNPEIARVPVVAAAGVSEFRFKIAFDADLYMMMIDDVQFVESADVDITMDGNPQSTAKYYTQPSVSADYDELSFSAMVKNNGSQPQDSITLQVDIIDNVTGNVVQTITGTDYGTTLPLGVSDSIGITETFELSNLSAGSYTVRITALTTQPDAFPENNVGSYEFNISDDNLFATCESVYTSYYPANNFSAAMGNVYQIPAAATEDYVIADIQTTYGFSAAAVDVTEKSISVLVTTIPDSITEDFGNLAFDGSTDPFNVTTIEQIAYQELSLAGTSEGELLTADIDSFIDANEFRLLDKIPLENGTRYLLWTVYSDSTLALALNNRNPRPGSLLSPILYLDRTYYGGGFTSGTQGILQMHIKLSTVADVAPLPESTMKVYPNPVRGSQLKVELEFEEPTDATITVADMNGIVHSINVYKNVMHQTVTENVSNLTAGTYIVRLATKEGTKTMKFIKL